ncbi:class I SAM-dependent methyltransferase [Synechococcus sp. UW140]|uniref:class I SAM-dependent methyltransferase n=1 Tax=Synechococcus sp. UW140 TaxID=368503 RepID=UPI003137D2B3
MTSNPNLDPRTVASFGDEWQRFDQKGMAPGEAEQVFGHYFAIFPWEQLPPNAEGFDMGCGSGRWARLVAPRVGKLHCIDPSSALAVARSTLADQPKVQFHQASVAASGLPPNSQDFGYSLGVLHHVPDTAAAIRSCAELLKPGAPLLLYLYYEFDNRPRWFRLLWHCSNAARLLIRRLPPRPKQLITDLIAFTVYWPLSRLASLAEAAGLPVASFPLSYYRHCSFYTMRTDARDRFGTPLEQRFSRAQIRAMCTAAGLVDLRFSPRPPYWCVVGVKAES